MTATDLHGLRGNGGVGELATREKGVKKRKLQTWGVGWSQGGGRGETGERGRHRMRGERIPRGARDYTKIKKFHEIGRNMLVYATSGQTEEQKK